MKPRLRALLVHGMGSDAAWWKPFLPALRDLEIEPVALAMPALDTTGPEAWCEKVMQHLGAEPVIVIGHSLGAAVCLTVAVEKPVAELVLLACPPFVEGFSPEPPRHRLSLTAIARVSRFLKTASGLGARVPCDAVHFVGENDPAVPVKQAAKLPFPVRMIHGAGHQLNRSPQAVAAVVKHIAQTGTARRHLDPGARLAWSGRRISALGLEETAPSPARLDVEITTRCQLACPVCARTLGYAPVLDRDMPLALFKPVLDGAPNARELILVGLGEPLLHADLTEFVAEAAGRELEVKLVTNGLLATADRLRVLHDAGLTEVTFSIDSADPAVFARRRGGASLETVVRNFRAVPPSLRKSIFTTLAVDNAGELPGIIDLAASERLPAIAVTDVNFAENQPLALRHASCEEALCRAIEHARTKKILLIGPQFHDMPAPWKNYRSAIVRRPADLLERASIHRHCLAPWRIAVVGVDGTVTPCNCAPATALGNVTETNLAAIWNGPRMRQWRRTVMTATCGSCASCPRF